MNNIINEYLNEKFRCIKARSEKVAINVFSIYIILNDYNINFRYYWNYEVTIESNLELIKRKILNEIEKNIIKK